jgi:hypothetical protein
MQFVNLESYLGLLFWLCEGWGRHAIIRKPKTFDRRPVPYLQTSRFLHFDNKCGGNRELCYFSLEFCSLHEVL